MCEWNSLPVSPSIVEHGSEVPTSRHQDTAVGGQSLAVDNKLYVCVETIDQQSEDKIRTITMVGLSLLSSQIPYIIKVIFCNLY